MDDDKLYNVFLNNNHSTKQEKILVNYNYNVVESIIKKLGTNKKKIELLELGVGKGYFTQACMIHNQKSDVKINYSAFDRNLDMLENLANFDRKIKTYSGDLPEIPIKGKKFDVVYCAFVVEHLHNGPEIFELISNIKKILNDGGLIVFFTPNALQQKFEFFNIDYTHHYPTTSRNVAMAFYDCNIMDVHVQKINGLCTYKGFENPFIRLAHKTIFKLYSYQLFAWIFAPVYRVPLWDLNNFFYRVFCFFKEENLMFVARYDKK